MYAYMNNGRVHVGVGYELDCVLLSPVPRFLTDPQPTNTKKKTKTKNDFIFFYLNFFSEIQAHFESKKEQFDANLKKIKTSNWLTL